MERPDQSDPVLQAAASLKAFMMKNSTDTNTNLFDHLIQVLLKVMDERPHNAVDVMEDLSRDLKRALFVDKQSTLRDPPQDLPVELLAQQQHLLFSRPEAAHQELEVGSDVPNVSELGFYLEQAGVGLGREELQRIFLSLKQLVESQSLLHCRLWGKILGTERSYIVAEGDRQEEEGSAEEEEEEKGVETPQNDSQMDTLPQSTYKPQPAVPMEVKGTGANKFVYYVCREPGLPWVQLPPVTPAQITIARQICKFFTGRLDAPVVSFPPFPGNEANYLRAQIARISAGTQVSPQGFFLVGEEEGEDEENSPGTGTEVNPDFEGVAASKMSESLSAWVHHVPHILKQGRCTWVNVAEKQGEMTNEELESEEKDEEADIPEPEIGPSLLTPLSQDAEMFNTAPWSLQLSSHLTSQHAVAVLRSNLWPGAYAYACEKKFENIYIGWGMKYTGSGYSPPVPPMPQEEYPSGPEITEDMDPSVEEEQALKEALEEQQAFQEDEDDTDEDEEDEEEDDD